MKKIWKPEEPLRDNVQQYLPAIVSEYFEQGRRAMTPGTPWDEMHEFRLLTKRLRYSLEIFRDVYGPGLERRIEALRTIQTLLGDINDCVVTAAMLAAVPGTDAVQKQLARKAEAKTAKLRRFWSHEFDRPAQCQRWCSYLARYACRPKALPRQRAPQGPSVDAESGSSASDNAPPQVGNDVGVH